MTNLGHANTDRWADYLLKFGEQHQKFWSEYLNTGKKDLLIVMGHGFDPRMCVGIKSLLTPGGQGKRDVLAIEFHRMVPASSMGENTESSEFQCSQKQKNLAELDDLIKDRGTKVIKPVQLYSSEGRIIGSRKAANVFTDFDDIKDYSDIIVDISALPRYIYFPLIGKLLHVLDQQSQKSQKKTPNLFVVVAENAEIDRNVQDVEIEETANYMYGFAGDLESEATANIPKVWIPILGENQIRQLERIYTLVNPEEICPIIPSPSVYPRRGDELIIEYREFLFDRLIVEPKNIIYAAEQNPFEVYRQIVLTFRHYNEVLSPLGGCKIAISALSSKLMSLGALLAVYELKNSGNSIGIANVETREYGFKEAKRVQDSILFTLWISGECYD